MGSRQVARASTNTSAILWHSRSNKGTL